MVVHLLFECSLVDAFLSAGNVHWLYSGLLEEPSSTDLTVEYNKFVREV